MSQRRRRAPAVPIDLKHPFHSETVLEKALGSPYVSASLAGLDDLPSKDFMPAGDRTWILGGPKRAMTPGMKLRGLPAAGRTHLFDEPFGMSGFGFGRSTSSASLAKSADGFAGTTVSLLGGPNSMSLPELRRVPRSLKQRIDPTSQNFAELTAGLSVSERVRWIPQEEHRGIMVKQLEVLQDFIHMHANSKSDVVNGWFDNSGKPIQFKIASFHDIMHWVVKPLTRPAKCSYVEAIAHHVDSQKPTWFASHWWGEPFVDFTSCIKGHAKNRGRGVCGVTSAYWVCAFARNLHANTEFVHNMEAAFCKAMCTCQGIVLVIDSAGPAMVFKRSWCCYELCIATMSLPHLSIDCVTLDENRECHIMSESLTSHEARGENTMNSSDDFSDLSSSWGEKAKREEKFPVKKLRNALNIKVIETETTVESDKKDVLVGILHGDPRFTVEYQDPKIDIIDRRLRARFGRAALRHAIQQQEDLSNFSAFGAEIGEAISGDPDAQSFNLNLSGCWKLRESAMETLARSIPPAGRMRSLNLNFKDCYQMASMSSLLDRVADAQGLESINLNFQKCLGLNCVDDFVAFAGRLSGCASSLKKMKLDLTGCQNLGSLADLVDALRSTRIPELTLVSPDGTNISLQEARSHASTEETKERAKPKKKWLSRTARMTWAKGNKR